MIAGTGLSHCKEEMEGGIRLSVVWCCAISMRIFGTDDDGGGDEGKCYDIEFKFLVQFWG